MPVVARPFSRPNSAFRRWVTDWLPWQELDGCRSLSRPSRVGMLYRDCQELQLLDHLTKHEGD